MYSQPRSLLTHTIGILLLVGMLGLLGAGSQGIRPALVRADTDPGCAVVELGSGNEAPGTCATVSGGQNNSASGSYAVVGGGGVNAATADLSTVGGGDDNFATGIRATVGGGRSNSASGENATVGGGLLNTANANYATVGGGLLNITSAIYATVGGGIGNRADASYATIGGGGTSIPNDLTKSNRVTDDYGTIGGGGNNQAGNNTGTSADSPYTTVGGGKSNTASDNYATVSGGTTNTASNIYASVGGGFNNSASGINAVVAGGQSNTASGNTTSIGGGVYNSASADFATIAGGGASNLSTPATGNRVTDIYGSIGGGGNNQAGNGTTSLSDRPYASVAGGLTNSASGSYAAVGGGRQNTASGSFAVVPGGYLNTASGSYSFASGRRAKATHTGAFVWSDSVDADFASTTNNQFGIRATGGVRIVTNNATPATGCSIPPGGGSWQCTSDRNAKANFAAVDSSSILERVAAMPIQLWNYKSQDASVKHIGPMAQDFASAFGLGDTDTAISMVDADGVALAAIQGLYQENQQLRRDVAALQAQGGARAQAGNSVQVASGGVIMTLNWNMVVLGALISPSSKSLAFLPTFG